MNRFERNQSQDPNHLAHKHQRRAHAAAWVVGIAGALGVPAAEAASAQPLGDSHAGIATGYELAGHAEQSPQAFVAMIDNKMAVREREIKSAPHVQFIKGSELSSTAPADVHAYFIWEPSHNSPRHYNLLVVAVRGNQKTPIFTALSLNADSNKLGQVKNSPDGYYVDHPQDIKGNFMPGTIQLAASKGSNVSTYAASVTNYDGNHPPFGEQTKLVFNPVSPAVVSGAFDGFFKHADEILAANSNK